MHRSQRNNQRLGDAHASVTEGWVYTPKHYGRKRVHAPKCSGRRRVPTAKCTAKCTRLSAGQAGRRQASQEEKEKRGLCQANMVQTQPAADNPLSINMELPSTSLSAGTGPDKKKERTRGCGLSSGVCKQIVEAGRSLTTLVESLSLWP